MTTPNDTYGWEQTKSIWNNKNYRFFYRILGGALLVAIGVLIGASLFAEKQFDYLMSLFTNVLSIFVTVFILDELNRWRQHKQEQNRLIREFGGQSNETAKRAIDELREQEWATGEKSLLQARNFRYSNWLGLDLWNVNLRGALLRHSNMAHTVLWHTDLRGADLRGANLEHAKMAEVILDPDTVLPDGTHWTEAVDLNQFTDPTHKNFWHGYNLNAKNLQGNQMSGFNLKRAAMRSSDLTNANLQDAKLNLAILFLADLTGANMEGAKLVGAELGNANLTNTQFNEDTILPDNSHWSHDTDMTRFTNPEHSNFWRSDDKNSPAYAEKKKT